ncbi:hypothetical protein SFBM_1039 [Candidatus Arthromitus sp. SFB-mouse-Japan]|uniref:DUF4214 domain-containing protein n=1 Tax=Candidatus Arthromitus sp. SFB-mouse TaxID=49118 RepID=UPI00021B7EBB|nr:DUF4214 domain-containing protein [Candidatus Arthromitus sp. SFB-mouse]BAK56803.1 hypothetical protein SFBM_1039 [Candidatus Arthromitus sp. SFB-mouse-Japan]
MCKKLCTLLLSLSFFVSGAITASAMDTQSVKESNITSRVFGTIGILDPDYEDLIIGGIEDSVSGSVTSYVSDITVNSAIVDIYTNSTGVFTLNLYRDYDDTLVYKRNETSRGSREFSLTGLTQDTDYYYEVVNASGQVVSTGTFTTLFSSISSGGSSSNSSVYADVTNRTDNSAIVRIYTNSYEDFTLDLYRNYDNTRVYSYLETSRGSREFRLTNLAQNTDYHYEIFNERNQVVYRGTFRTLSSSTSSGGSNSSIYAEIKNRTTDSAIVDVYNTNINHTLSLDLYRDSNNKNFVANFSETSRGSRQFRLTNLVPGTDYFYEIINQSDNRRIIYRGTFRTLASSSNNTTTISYEITTNDVNKAAVKDVTVSIPVSNTSLANSMNEGRNFSTNVEGVTVTYKSGNVEFVGLVPEKQYKDLTISYTDKNGTSRKVTVAIFTTKASETKLRQFMVDVYKYSLNRQADEKGFAYWETQLSRRSTLPEKFVANLLSEREFLNLNTTTNAKIEALYKVIVNRNSDAVGLKYWTDKLDTLQKNGYSDSSALGSIVTEMVNESEFQRRIRELGI